MSNFQQLKKAILVSQLENELDKILSEIKHKENIVNSIKIRNDNYKRKVKTKIKKLIQKKQELTDKITEMMFLDN